MKISPEERAKRVEAARYARGTMGLVEGYKPSPFARELQARWIDGEIKIDEAIEETRRHFGLPDLAEPWQG
ncbi:antitoxin VbhA family protein [Pseudomonas aeruginosa]|uniref:antitoxin VbhA family protein n=1 Tax=Pseudomonas aeruginosa TaxID=287 RepID=UPI0031B6EB0A